MLWKHIIYDDSVGDLQNLITLFSIKISQNGATQKNQPRIRWSKFAMEKKFFVIAFHFFNTKRLMYWSCMILWKIPSSLKELNYMLFLCPFFLQSKEFCKRFLETFFRTISYFRTISIICTNIAINGNDFFMIQYIHFLKMFQS